MENSIKLKPQKRDKHKPNQDVFEKDISCIKIMQNQADFLKQHLAELKKLNNKIKGIK